jgi:hypothetical protein
MPPKQTRQPDYLNKESFLESDTQPSYLKRNGSGEIEIFASHADYRSKRGRAEFLQEDFLAQRPSNVLSKKFHDIVYYARGAYESNGLIRNVIDLMTDFVCEDIQVVHTAKRHDRFFKAWSKKVNLYDRVNEFSRRMFIDYNVFVKRNVGHLSEEAQQHWREIFASHEMEMEDMYLDREIPVKYTFLDITKYTWENGVLHFRDMNIKNTIKPGPVVRNIQDIWIAHNKKDDWADWSIPFLNTVLGDLVYKSRLKQMDLGAMDGIINLIRLWKLGDHEKDIWPGDPVFDKLAGILQANTGGGTMDILWNSAIKMEPFYPPVDKILGPDKFTQVDKDILIGLGIPEILLGAGASKGLGNNFIQLKAVIERLKYVRKTIEAWLENELRIICKNLHIHEKPIIVFGQMNLDDDALNKRLILNLVDRGLVSAKTVNEMFGFNLDIELPQMETEEKLYKKAGIEKISPFAKPEPEPAPAPRRNENVTQPKEVGRPVGARDKEKRKPKRITPQRNVSKLVIKASQIEESFNKEVLPDLLEIFGIKNWRQASKEQSQKVENLKNLVFSSISPDVEDVSGEILYVLDNTDNVNNNVFAEIQSAIKNIGQKDIRDSTRIATWIDHYLE